MKKKNREGAVGGKAINNVINVLLALGCLTILFPLYMTVIIAFKKPSEMTNDVAGALGFPANWNFDNFIEAMRVTDFWRSLGNSLFLTGVTVIICILLHSLAGYVIGRKMAKHKLFKASYFYIVSGMFVPFAVLIYCKWNVCTFFSFNDAISETDSSDWNGKSSWCYCLVCGIFYANECIIVFWVFKKYSHCFGRSCMCGRGNCLADILENNISQYETYACYSGSFNCNEYME